MPASSWWRRNTTPPVKFTISTDALSCRLMAARPDAARHVVFLGDSSTVGLGVGDEETFASLIQERSEELQCRNLGCVGYTAYQGRRRLETFPFDQPPDVVVMAFGVNDNLPWDNLGDAAHDRLLRCGTEGLGRVSALYGAIERAVLTMRFRSAAPRKRLTDAEFAEQLGGMIQWCRARRAEPILLLWPYEPQLRANLYNSKQTAMTQVAQRERVKLIDLVPVFKSHSHEALFFTEVHLNAAGHSLVADTLLPHLGASPQP